MFIHDLLDQGIADKFFNIAHNFAQDNNGNTVLIDLGEIVTDQQKINELRKRRVWALSYKLKGIRDRELQKYFVEQMDKHFGSSE